MKRLLSVLFSLGWLICASVQAQDALITGEGWRYEELRRLPAEEARQGVACDGDHVYAINNYEIGRYRLSDGQRVGRWAGEAGGPIIHLNAGIVRDGRLICAHSNFPGVPMQSSIEIWDTETMEHVGSRSLGRTDGSLTWIDRRNNRWIACFVHYGRRGGEPGRGPEWTHLVEFDDEGRRLGGWTFPAELIARVGERGYSISGGAIGPGGYLYVTGHDHPELYVLEFPRQGTALRWVTTLSVAGEGQAFGWDPRDPGILYMLARGSREIIVGRVQWPGQQAR